MDMNRIFFLRNEDRKPAWRVIDAKDQVVGRLASQIVRMLRGVDKASYTPHTMSGDYIIVINADKVKFTGKKMQIKEYVWYTGYAGGQRMILAKDLMAKDPTALIRNAVKGMLPKNRISSVHLKNLKIYAGDKHPHAAQVAGFPVAAPAA